MIVFENVSKSFRTARGLKVILDNFDCELSTDRNIGILGRNGSGKSTLIRMISGSQRPDRGRIRSDARLSFPVGHTAALSPMMTGRENARFMARVYRDDTNRVVRFVQEFSELGDYLDEPLRAYSNGMRARLGFAICMAIDFDIYLIDEITSVGDLEFKRKCIRFFAQRRKNSTVVMVSQNYKTIRQLCEDVALLADGGIQMIEQPPPALTAGLDDGEASEVLAEQGEFV
jgi:capsular polysaccharide transport system ATP-binding protein